MEILREILAWLVTVIGLMGWVIFLPQISLLLKVKKSDTISAGMLWGSFIMQIIILTHILLKPDIDWGLSIVYFTNSACAVVLLSVVYYYRRWPGER